MKLFTQAIAPNPTKVELYLAEKAAGGCAIALEREPVNLREGHHREAGFTSINPLQRVPVLQLDDGTYIAESLPIIEYLEELNPEPALIGTTPEERARTRAIERIIDLDILVSIGIIVHATNSPVGYPPSPAVAERFVGRLNKTLPVIDDYLASGGPFVMGAAPTIADCTLEAALQFGRFANIEINPDNEAVLAWDAMYRARDPIAQVLMV